MLESESITGTMQDKLMFNLIGNQVIYNISWEDPRIDRALLNLGPDDVMMMLTSAGCNVLDYLLEGPKKIISKCNLFHKSLCHIFFKSRSVIITFLALDKPHLDAKR